MTDRAVSSTLNYVLSLGIATILTTGLLMSGGSFVQDRQEQVIRGELEVIGQQIASDLYRADRLVSAGDGNTEIRLNQTLPNRITGSTYRVEVDGTELQLTSTDPEISVVVHAVTETDLKDGSSANGGTVVVEYDQSSDSLEVGND